MAGSVTEDLLPVSVADSTTGWSGTSGQLDNEVYKQGSGAYTYQTAKNSLEGCTFTPATNINMTANYTTPHLYWTMRCDVFPFCELLNTSTTNSGLMVRVTDGSGNYTQWHVAGSDTWDGSWRNFVLDLTNTADIHSTSGTLSLANVDIITWYTDNSNSGNIRIIDNTWLDAVRYGDGLQANSTTTEAFDFTDIALDDALTTNYYGVIQNTDGVLFAQGKLIIGDATDTNDTNFVSDGETVYFRDQIVSSSHYAIVGTEATSATNPTDISISGLVCKTVGSTGAEFDFSDVDINSFALLGSTLINMGALSFATGSVDSTKFTDCGTTTIGSGTTTCDIADSTWDTCDAITLTDGTISDCFITNSTSSASVITADIEVITGTAFTSDGSNHAVELTSLGDGSLAWDNTLSGYVTGATGSPVTPTSTGNEAIYVNVGTGTVTFNVSATATLPSIRSAGATVNVVAGQVDFSFTLSPAITGYEWRIYEADATQGIIGTTQLAGEETASVSSQTYTYTYSSDTAIAVQIISDGYEEVVNYYTLKNTDQTITINLTVEENT